MMVGKLHLFMWGKLRESPELGRWLHSIFSVDCQTRAYKKTALDLLLLAETPQPEPFLGSMYSLKLLLVLLVASVLNDGVDDAAILALHGFGSEALMPDRTILLTLPPARGVARATLRDGERADRFIARDAAFHQRVAAAFARVAALDGLRVLLIEGDLQQPSLAAALFLVAVVSVEDSEREDGDRVVPPATVDEVGTAVAGERIVVVTAGQRVGRGVAAAEGVVAEAS